MRKLLAALLLGAGLAAPAHAQALADINDPKFDELYCVHDLLNDRSSLERIGAAYDQYEGDDTFNWEYEWLAEPLKICTDLYRWNREQQTFATEAAEWAGIHSYRIEQFILNDDDKDYNNNHIATMRGVEKKLSKADIESIVKLEVDVHDDQALVKRFYAAMEAAGAPKGDDYLADEALTVVYNAIMEQKNALAWLAAYPSKPGAPKVTRDPIRGNNYDMEEDPARNCVGARLLAKRDVAEEIAKDYLNITTSPGARDKFQAEGRACRTQYGWTDAHQIGSQTIGLQMVVANYLEQQMKARGVESGTVYSVWLNMTREDRIAFTGAWNENKALIARTEKEFAVRPELAKISNDWQMLFYYLEAMSVEHDARAAFPRDGGRRPLPKVY